MPGSSTPEDGGAQVLPQADARTRTGDPFITSVARRLRPFASVREKPVDMGDSPYAPSASCGCSRTWCLPTRCPHRRWLGRQAVEERQLAGAVGHRVGVDLRGDLGVRVPEPLGHLGDAPALVEQHAPVRVAEGVMAHADHARPLHRRVEHPRIGRGRSGACRCACGTSGRWRRRRVPTASPPARGRARLSGRPPASSYSA